MQHQHYTEHDTLYLSILFQRQSIIIDQGISAPGNGKYVVVGINAIDKRCMYQLKSNIQLPG